jgi:hypothetical protein
MVNGQLMIVSMWHNPAGPNRQGQPMPESFALSFAVPQDAAQQAAPAAAYGAPPQQAVAPQYAQGGYAPMQQQGWQAPPQQAAAPQYGGNQGGYVPMPQQAPPPQQGWQAPPQQAQPPQRSEADRIPF